MNLEGVRPGDQVMAAWEQCEGCGVALDAEGSAVLDTRGGKLQIRCSDCGSCYPVTARG